MADATHKNVRGTPAGKREYDIKDIITIEVGKTDGRKQAARTWVTMTNVSD